MISDLTNRDFEDVLRALVERAQTANPGKWNSWFEGDLGKVLVDLMAWDSTVIGLIGDQQVRESYPDTLRLRESLLHFARLHGYYLRRNVPARLSARVEAQQAPVAPNFWRVRRGTKVTSGTGQVWEVARDCLIEAGHVTPVSVVMNYGDLQGVNLDDAGVPTQAAALVMIKKGEARATLVDLDGVRYGSDLGFSRVVPGHILKLTAQLTGLSFGPPPDVTRDEFAVLSVSKLPDDQFDGSVLYLDRPWDLDDYVGKWRVEDRAIELTHAETLTETFEAPSELGERLNLRVSGSFHPVISATSEPLVPSGALQAALNATFNGSGVRVLVNGVQWDETAFLLLESADAQTYQADFDDLDRVTIIFGDGIHGAVPPPNAAITLEYRVGGGEAGNVGPGTFTATVRAESAQAGAGTTCLLSNPYAGAAGGQDRESLEAAKDNLRAFIRTNDRAVSEADYEYLASNFVDGQAGRIALARAVRHRNTVPREQNIVWVYAWVRGPNGQLAAPTLALKRRLRDYLEARKVITDEVVVKDGTVDQVPLVVRVRYRAGVADWDLREMVRTALFQVFTNQTPGLDLNLSSLYAKLREVELIEMVAIEHPSANLEASPQQLYGNTLVEGAATTLSLDCFKGEGSLSVVRPDLFDVGGLVMVHQANRTPTVARIESVSGSVLVLRDAVLKDDYDDVQAEVFNADLVVRAWNSEHEVSVFVRYESGAPAGLLDHSVRFQLLSYFGKVLKPGDSLTRDALQLLVASVSGVSAVTVNLGAYDSLTEEVTAGQQELITLGSLSINGAAQPLS